MLFSVVTYLILWVSVEIFELASLFVKSFQCFLTSLPGGSYGFRWSQSLVILHLDSTYWMKELVALLTLNIPHLVSPIIILFIVHIACSCTRVQRTLYKVNRLSYLLLTPIVLCYFIFLDKPLLVFLSQFAGYLKNLLLCYYV